MIKIANQSHRRRVPGTHAGKLDRPWSMKKTIKLEIDSTAQWHDMIGPIGIYYIWMTGNTYILSSYTYYRLIVFFY